MFRDYERRDHYDTRSDNAAQHAQNTELPQWLRNAWQAVADGRISSVAEYREGVTSSSTSSTTRNTPEKRPATPSQESRIEYLESKLRYMGEAIKRERARTPEAKNAARLEELVDKLMSEPATTTTDNARRAYARELDRKKL